MASSDVLTRLCERLGYHFRDSELLLQALTHRSAGGKNNERLEFLGDAVLDLVVAEALYRRFPMAPEGDLTRLRAVLVKGKTLAELGVELGLGDCLQLGAGEIKTGGSRRESVLADAMEAVLGAVYLEAGLATCETLVRAWLGKRLEDISLTADSKDAKTRLQELLQGQGLPLPVYHIVSADGDPHNQVFTVACTIAGETGPFIASAQSRKNAEKQAAQLALDHLLSDTSHD